MPRASRPVPWRRIGPETGGIPLRSGRGSGPSPPSFGPRCPAPSDQWPSSAKVRSHRARRAATVIGSATWGQHISTPRTTLRVTAPPRPDRVCNQTARRAAHWQHRPSSATPTRNPVGSRAGPGTPCTARRRRYRRWRGSVITPSRQPAVSRSTSSAGATERSGCADGADCRPLRAGGCRARRSFGRQPARRWCGLRRVGGAAAGPGKRERDDEILTGSTEPVAPVRGPGEHRWLLRL